METSSTHARLDVLFKTPEDALSALESAGFDTNLIEASPDVFGSRWVYKSDPNKIAFLSYQGGFMITIPLQQSLSTGTQSPSLEPYGLRNEVSERP